MHQLLKYNLIISCMSGSIIIYDFPVKNNVTKHCFLFTGSILFLLKGSTESGFTFEGLAKCITFCSTTHCVMVRVVKVFTATATLPNRSQPLQKGQEVTWPSNLVALYRMTTAPNESSDGNSSNGKLHCYVEFDINTPTVNKVIKPNVLSVFKTSHETVIKAQFVNNNNCYDKMFDRR